MNKKRLKHLQDLADEFDIDLDFVIQLAELYGESEDYDGLVVALQDYNELRKMD